MFSNPKKEIGRMARNPGTTVRGGAFSDETIEAVWMKGTPEPGLTTYRKDACGASMNRSKHGKTEQYGWEIDHIKPVAQGGTDALSNLQPLQWENNRHKGDDWPDWSCKVKS
jgi:HNH endonuclease